MAVLDAYDEIITMLGSQYAEINGCDFYQYLFPDNEESGKMYMDFSHPNAVYLYQDARDIGTDRRLRRRIMLADTWESDYMEYVEGNPMTLCSGLSYRGRRNRLEDAQNMNALVFDLDGVGGRELRNLFLRFGAPAGWIRTMPMPTFLVASGGGLHVYYVFEQPIDLFPNIKLQLKALKYDLTFRLWEYKATSMNKEIQYQSINQGFRMVGSMNSKYGNMLRAFQTGNRVTLEYLNEYADPISRVNTARPFRPSKLTRAEAKEAYPEWYQRVVVERQRQRKKWDIKGKQGYALYEWWLRQSGKVKGGHRYYFMMCLVIYACKCDVPKDKLEKDLYDVYEELRRVKHDNPLTEEDVRSALETYDREYYNFTIADIEKLTDIRIERNKRNHGVTQQQHLYLARSRKKEMKHIGLPMKAPEGRPRGSGTKEKLIKEYIKNNPDANITEIAKTLGISRTTVYKYYDNIWQELFGILAQSDKQTIL